MSIQETMRGKEPVEAVTFSRSRIKRIERYLLERKIRVFLAKGGKITGADDGEIKTNFNGSGVNQADRARENNRKKCLKASMNAKFYPTAQDNIYHSDANKDKFVVIISKYISRQFDYPHQAVNHRDFYLRKLENAGNN